MPPLYLLDTSVLLALLRAGVLGEYILANFDLYSLEQPPIISVVTEGEMRSLALRLGWKAPRQRALEELLGRLTIVPIPIAGLIEAYTEIDVYSLSKGRPMGKNDLWIAATANALRATLLTTDRDFDVLKYAKIELTWINPISHL